VKNEIDEGYEVHIAGAIPLEMSFRLTARMLSPFARVIHRARPEFLRNNKNPNKERCKHSHF
jgi:hypothetical protein